MSIWKDMLEETVKQSSGRLLENQLPCDSSIVGKVRNAVTSSVFGIIVWETIKAANNAASSLLKSYEMVSVKDPKTGQEMEFDNMDSFIKWLASLDDKQAKKLLEDEEERRRKRRLAALDFEH